MCIKLSDKNFEAKITRNFIIKVQAKHVLLLKTNRDLQAFLSRLPVCVPIMCSSIHT